MVLIITRIGQNAETATLVASLREVIQKQAQDIESLQSKLKELSTQSEEVSLIHFFPYALHSRPN